MIARTETETVGIKEKKYSLSYMFDVQSLVKYLLEGMAVVVAAYYIPKQSVDMRTLAILGVTAAAVFAVLDTLSPEVAHGARQGAGFSIGSNIVGGGCSDTESSMESSSESDTESEHEPVGIDPTMETFSSVI